MAFAIMSRDCDIDSNIAAFQFVGAVSSVG